MGEEGGLNQEDGGSQALDGLQQFAISRRTGQAGSSITESLGYSTSLVDGNGTASAQDPNPEKQDNQVDVTEEYGPPFVPTIPEADTAAIRSKSAELLLRSIKGHEECPEASIDPQILAELLEEEIYKDVRNAGIKYKRRVRSRVSNLSDFKNPNLRLNFLKGAITPADLAKMTSEEMASDEMKRLRELIKKGGLRAFQLDSADVQKRKRHPIAGFR